MTLELTDTQTLRQHLVTPVISLTFVTWNLEGTLPSINSIKSLAHSSHLQHSPTIIFFATQECQRSLWLTCCLESKTEWESMLKEAFPLYILKWSGTMRGLHSAILTKKGEEKDVKVENVEKLRSGAGGWMGTKGAIGVTISFKGTLLQIINCHLASGQENSEKRTSTLQKILEKIVQKRSGCQLVVLGDLNYRVEITSKEYIDIIAESKGKWNQKYSYLLQNDQYSLQEGTFKDVLQEKKITFPPTYKLDSNTGIYCPTHQFGWTDRIFSRKSGILKQLSYDCEYQMVGSDHRPVIARFERPLNELMDWKKEKQDTKECCLLM